MTATYVYAIIPAGDHTTFDVAGVDDHHDQVYSLPYRRLAAVVSRTSRSDYRGMARQEVLRYLVAHQRVVEAVMATLPVLPVKFGTVLPDEARVHLLLEQGEAGFRSTLEGLADRVQMEVVVTWDLAAVFQEIGAEEDITRAKARAVGGPPEDVAAARVAVGQMVKGALDRRRSELQDHLILRLRDVACDLVANPLLDDRMVANVALLLNRADREALDRRLVELDRQFEGRLNFRCVGPLPPYSFATVEVEIPTYAAVSAAGHLLGLGEQAALSEIKRAYRRVAAQLHPDVSPDGEDVGARMAELAEAHRLLTAYGKSQVRGQGETPEPVCTFDREAVARTLLISLVGQEGRGSEEARGSSRQDAETSGLDGPEESVSVTDAKAQIADSAGAAGTGYYVYAVARARDGSQYEAAVSIDLGCPSAYGLAHRDLAAIVSPVPLAEFGQDVLEANLQDLAWVGGKVLAHQEVLAGLLDRYTLIPFKFGTVFGSEDTVREMIEGHYQRFAETLRRLEGATEWGVKLYCDRRALVERVREASEGLGTLREAISRGSEGAAYFLKKKLEQAAEQEAEQVVDASVRESHGRLAGRAREAVVNPVQPPEVHRRGMEMVLNGAYLVDDRNFEAFRGAMASLDETYASLGLSFELTGPWPPFSFVAEETEASSGERTRA